MTQNKKSNLVFGVNMDKIVHIGIIVTDTEICVFWEFFIKKCIEFFKVCVIFCVFTNIQYEPSGHGLSISI